MVNTSLPELETRKILDHLSTVDKRMAAEYPGASGARQPVHTCYVPADQADDDTVHRWRSEALGALERHAATPAELARILGMPEDRAAAVYPRLDAKLRADPVEDLRIDFEDGYGVRDEHEEDADTERVAGVLAGWWRAGAAPRHTGLRVKSFDGPGSRARGVRTLDVFLTHLLAATGELPEGFVLTFPKVVDVAQIEAFVQILRLLEQRLGLASGALRFEIQVETTQSIIDSSGRFALPGFLRAGSGRVTGLHFGTYDYTASCGLTAEHQHLAHRACDFARHAMQVAAAGTGVFVSDGSTNVLPTGAQVEHGWRTHYELVHRSLAHGFHQGWDLHPAQLVSRYAAVFTAFLDAAPAQSERLRGYVTGTGGAVLDEPATARALAASFVRALDTGATDAAEVAEMAGLDERRLRELAHL